MNKGFISFVMKVFIIDILCLSHHCVLERADKIFLFPDHWAMVIYKQTWWRGMGIIWKYQTLNQIGTWVISGEVQNEYFMLRRARCFRWNTAHSSVYFFLLFLGSKLPCIPRSSSQLAVSDGLFSSQETASRNDRWHLLINVLILDFTWTRNLLV